VSEQGELEEAVACPLSPPGGERQQHQQERRQRERQEDIVVQSMIPEVGVGNVVRCHFAVGAGGVHLCACTFPR